MPDTYAVANCLRKDKHCDICCNHFIGEVHISDIENCVSKCNELLGNNKEM